MYRWWWVWSLRLAPCCTGTRGSPTTRRTAGCPTWAVLSSTGTSGLPTSGSMPKNRWTGEEANWKSISILQTNNFEKSNINFNFIFLGREKQAFSPPPLSRGCDGCDYNSRQLYKKIMVGVSQFLYMKCIPYAGRFLDLGLSYSLGRLLLKMKSTEQHWWCLNVVMYHNWVNIMC